MVEERGALSPACRIDLRHKNGFIYDCHGAKQNYSAITVFPHIHITFFQRYNLCLLLMIS